MKNNYPIRYVALPITENGRWESENEYIKNVMCYLVIKCYVVGEESRYDKDGEVSKKYQIVPTYGTIFPHSFQMIEPKYDSFGMNKCENSLFAERVFDNIEDAEKYRDERNKEIIETVVDRAPKWAKLREKFDKTLKEYQKIEKELEKNNAYLPVDGSKKRKQKIYGVDDATGLIDEEISVYSLLEECIYNDCNFVVYSISEEEAKELDKVLENDAKADAFNLDIAEKFMHTPLMMHEYNDNFVKLIVPNNKAKYVTIGECPYLDEQKKSKSYKGIEFEEYFFTMETYNDIIEAYNLDSKRANVLKLQMRLGETWIKDKYKY